MRKDPIGEKFVSHVWDGGHFIKTNLRAKDGRELEILHPGEWNTDAGADFRNARIKIDGETFIGDIEIHVKNSDWRIHHHDRNPKYNSTILHVAFWDGGISLLTRKQNGEYIPTLILCDYIDRSIGRMWRIIENEENPCPHSVTISSMNPELLREILNQTGAERLIAKSKKFDEQIGIKGVDQTLYEGIMDALGYSKNREQFRQLAEKVPVELLIGQTPETIQAILFGVAGLLPSEKKLNKETKQYLNIIIPLWERFAPQFCNVPMSADDWVFFRLRADNFPTRRIAGISYVLAGCDGSSGDTPLLTKFLNPLAETGKTSSKLRKILMPEAIGYWARHYSFGDKKHKQSKFLIGKNRADDIIINVILPMLLACSQESKLRESVIGLYTGYTALQDNRITRFFSERVFRSIEIYRSTANSASRQQGLIHIYKWFCEVQNCDNCPFMEQS